MIVQRVETPWSQFCNCSNSTNTATDSYTAVLHLLRTTTTTTTTTVLQPFVPDYPGEPVQKKHSPTHTYCDHQSSFICFRQLLRSI